MRVTSRASLLTAEDREAHKLVHEKGPCEVARPRLAVSVNPLQARAP